MMAVIYEAAFAVYIHFFKFYLLKYKNSQEQNLTNNLNYHHFQSFCPPCNKKILQCFLLRNLRSTFQRDPEKEHSPTVGRFPRKKRYLWVLLSILLPSLPFCDEEIESSRLIFPRNRQVSGRGELKINLVWGETEWRDLFKICFKHPIYLFLPFHASDILSFNIDIHVSAPKQYYTHTLLILNGVVAVTV